MDPKVVKRDGDPAPSALTEAAGRLAPGAGGGVSQERSERMNNTGYDTRPVKSLSNAELVEQFLQTAYDSGYYAAMPYDEDTVMQGGRAMARRNECQAEMKRRLDSNLPLAAEAGRAE